MQMPPEEAENLLSSVVKLRDSWKHLVEMKLVGKGKCIIECPKWMCMKVCLLGISVLYYVFCSSEYTVLDVVSIT